MGNIGVIIDYPQKKLETQSVLTGEAVPVLGKGIITLANGLGSLPRAIDGDVSIGDHLWVRNAGLVTGVSSPADVPADCQNLGQVIGTGCRYNEGVAPDQFAGASVGTGVLNESGLYAVVRLNIV